MIWIVFLVGLLAMAVLALGGILHALDLPAGAAKQAPRAVPESREGAASGAVAHEFELNKKTNQKENTI